MKNVFGTDVVLPTQEQFQEVIDKNRIPALTSSPSADEVILFLKRLSEKYQSLNDILNTFYNISEILLSGKIGKNKNVIKSGIDSLDKFLLINKDQIEDLKYREDAVKAINILKSNLLSKIKELSINLSEKSKKTLPKSSEVLNPEELLSSLEILSKAYIDLVPFFTKVSEIFKIISSEKPQKYAPYLNIGLTESEKVLKEKSQESINPEEKEFILNIIRNIIKYFVNKISSLPEYAKENLSKSLESTKERLPPPLKSSWHSSKVTFEHNLGRIISKDENIPFEQAKEKAKEEWNKIENIINELISNNKNLDKNELENMFTRSLFGGASFEESEKLVRKFAETGPKEFLFEDVEIPSDPEDIQDLIDDINDENKINQSLENIDESVKAQIANKIKTFAELSEEFFNITKDYVGRELSLSPEEYDNIIEISETVFDKISSIAQDLMLLDNSILGSDLLFADVYALYKGLVLIASELDLDLKGNAKTESEAFGENLTISNPIGNVINEFYQEKTKRPRNKEKAKKHIKTFWERISESEKASELRKKRLEQFKKSNIANEEKKLISYKFYDSFKKQIIKSFNYFITLMDVSEDDLNKKANNLNNLIIKVCNNIFSSNLNDVEKNKLFNNLKYYTSNTLRKNVKEMQKNKGYINKKVIDYVDNLINLVPKFFDDAKEKSISSKIAKIYELSSVFFKTSIR